VGTMGQSERDLRVYYFWAVSFGRRIPFMLCEDDSSTNLEKHCRGGFRHTETNATC
jgi:hypothetical protein